MLFGEMLVNVAMAALLAFIVERSIEWTLGEGLEHYFPDLDRFFLRYVAFSAGGGVSYLVNLNIFEALPIPHEIGVILTLVLVGCGMEVLHDVVNGGFNKGNEIELLVKNLGLAEEYIGELEREVEPF